jgi:cytoskeletal protein CcmA (bactofilin family)
MTEIIDANGGERTDRGPSSQDSEYGDLVLSGIGNSTGGRFRYASIDGKGRIDGDLQCEALRMNGLSRVDGHVKARTVDVNGMSSFLGDVIAGHIRLNGKVRIHRHLKGEDIEIFGSVRIDGDCEAERLALHGNATVQRTINAETIDIRMQGAYRTTEIGCASLRVQPLPIGLFRQWLGVLLPSVLPRLYVDLIEGDEVELANTTAGIVRGNRITVGSGCRIGQVEYRDSCQIDDTSVVRSKVRKGNGQ